MNSEINLVIVGDLAYDQSITPKGTRRVLAGAAYNTAIAASTVAKPDSIGIVARVGQDFDEGVNALKRRKINTEGIAVIPKGKTAVFTITQYEDNTRELESDPGVSDKVDTSIYPVTYTSPAYVHLASSHPEKYLTWIPYLRRSLPSGAIISADANDLFIENAIDTTVTALQSVDLVFINEAELTAIKTRYPDFVFSQPIILKRGPQGASYIDTQEGIEFSAQAPSVEVVDTSGAGDTLAGVFLALRAKGIDIQDALTSGVETASKTVTEFGVEHLNP